MSGPSVIQICNMALAHVSKGMIEDFSEGSAEADYCNLFYATCRRATLEGHDWNFASRYQTLAEVDDEVPGWDYVYQYPADCCKAREIYDESGEVSGTYFDYETGMWKYYGPVKFRIMTNSAKNTRLLVTDKDVAKLRYTADVEDPNIFDSEFIAALAYRLAADLAIPLTGDRELQESMMKEFSYRVGSAISNNANEDDDPPEEVSDFERARA